MYMVTMTPRMKLSLDWATFSYSITLISVTDSSEISLKSDLSQHDDNTEGALNLRWSDSG